MTRCGALGALVLTHPIRITMWAILGCVGLDLVPSGGFLAPVLQMDFLAPFWNCGSSYGSYIIHKKSCAQDGKKS